MGKNNTPYLAVNTLQHPYNVPLLSQNNKTIETHNRIKLTYCRTLIRNFEVNVVKMFIITLITLRESIKSVNDGVIVSRIRINASLQPVIPLAKYIYIFTKTIGPSM